MQMLATLSRVPSGTCVALDSIFISVAYRLYVIIGRLGGVIRWIELCVSPLCCFFCGEYSSGACALPLKDLRGSGEGDSKTKRKEPTLDE